jgi:hypothetical protein
MQLRRIDESSRMFYLCSMSLHGYAPAARLFESSAADRFWYWQGASGRSYIHSIYNCDTCPPLPGAVYVAVRRHGNMRFAVGTGRFPNVWERGRRSAASLLAGTPGADEIHVHLLARNEEAAEAVCQDLEAALRSQPRGASESAQPALATAA